MERKDFGFTYNVRGYMIKYKSINIGGAGILPDAKGPRGRGVQTQLKEYQRLAEVTILQILAGGASTAFQKAIALIDMELKIGGWSGTIYFEDHGQDFLRWKVINGQVTNSEPFQTWVWEGTIIKNANINKGDILFVTLPGGGRTTMRYLVEKVKKGK